MSAGWRGERRSQGEADGDNTSVPGRYLKIGNIENFPGVFLHDVLVTAHHGRHLHQAHSSEDELTRRHDKRDVWGGVSREERVPP